MIRIVQIYTLLVLKMDSIQEVTQPKQSQFIVIKILVAALSVAALTASCSTDANSPDKLAQKSCIAAPEKIAIDPNSMKIDNIEKGGESSNWRTFTITATLANRAGGRARETYGCTTSVQGTAGWRGTVRKKQAQTISPAMSRVFYYSGECFKQLPLTNDPRHTDDAGSAAGAADGAKGE